MYSNDNPPLIKHLKMNKKSFLRYQLIDKYLKRNLGPTYVQLAEQVNEELSELNVEEEDGKLKMKYTVTDRMIRIDIEEMQNIYPVTILKKNGRLYYENREDSIDNVDLRDEDKHVLGLAVQTFNMYKGTPFFEKFDDIITRIMTNSILRKITKRNSKKFIQIGEMHGDTGQQWLEKIYEAISEEKTLKVHYVNYGEKASIRTISPYLLKEYRNKWYLIAYVHEVSRPEKTLLMNLSRIEKIEDSIEQFIIDKGFDPDDYFKFCLGVFHMHGTEPIDVKLKLKGSIIKLVLEDKIHPTQEIITKTDDELIVRFRVYNTPELKNLIMSYGKNCEVIEPLTLRKEIKESLMLAINNY